MGAVSGRGLQGLHNDRLDLVIADVPWTTATGFIQQTSQALVEKSLSPLAHGPVRDLQLPRHHTAVDAIGATQHNAGTQSKILRSLGAFGPADESFAISEFERERSLGAPALLDVNLIAGAARDSNIISRTSEAGH
jgi:hypothetical protein